MKILIVGCIFLFSIILPSIQGTITTDSSDIEDNIITVDNEGDGDYTSIKDALNNANPRDTIEVYSGTYYEHGIDVEKEGITFQGISHELGSGNDTGKPFIDGEGINYVFLFTAENITIDGFCIENEEGSTHDILVLSEDSEGCIISHNNIFHSGTAIIYAKGSYHKIINNNIGYSIGYYGICLRDPCNNCLVSGNNISHCKDGILMWGSSSHTIIGNRITNCSRYGVDFALGDHTTFEGNHIEGNNIGINMAGSDVSIKNNNFLNNRNNILYYTEIGWIKEMFFSVQFKGNYYDNYLGIGPKIIWGMPWLVPFTLPLNIDWHPAKQPYDF